MRRSTASPRGGRLFEPVLEAIARRVDGEIELLSPAVGSWRGYPPASSIVTPGGSVGELEILGVLHRIVAPEGAAGVVTPAERRLGEIPLAYGDIMLVLDPEGAVAAGREVATGAREATDDLGLVLQSPLSGRFYARPSPDKQAFVQPGDVVTTGQTVGLLEVMKTFNRITYGGSGLPERARIVAIVPGDEADLDAGDPILRLEPA